MPQCSGSVLQLELGIWSHNRVIVAGIYQQLYNLQLANKWYYKNAFGGTSQHIEEYIGYSVGG